MSEAPRRDVAWTVALVATLTMTVSYIDRQTFAALAPKVTAALDIGETEYGWLGSAFNFAYLFATPLAGWWLAKVGARRGLATSVLVWSAVAALHSLVPGIGVMFALRIALGLAEGPGFPGAAQTIHRVLPPADRPRGFGLLFTGSLVGGAIAPPLASALYRAIGWRFAFLGTAAVGLAWLAPWFALTRRRDVRDQLDAGDARAGAVRGGELGRLVAHPVMVRALVAVFGAAPLVGFVYGWGAKYLAREFRVDQGDVGTYLWLPPLAFGASALLFGDLSARQKRPAGAPPRALVALGMLLAAAIALAPLTATPWQAVAVFSVGMAGGAAIYTLVTGDLLARVPDELVSQASGVLAGAQSLALIVASPLIGDSIERTHDYVAVTIALGVWPIPGAIAWLVWRVTRYEARSRSTP